MILACTPWTWCQEAQAPARALRILRLVFGSAIAGTGVGWIADRWSWHGVFLDDGRLLCPDDGFSALTLGHKAVVKGASPSSVLTVIVGTSVCVHWWDPANGGRDRPPRAGEESPPLPLVMLNCQTCLFPAEGLGERSGYEGNGPALIPSSPQYRNPADWPPALRPAT